MKNILFTALLAFSVMSLTTGCSMMGGESGSKCGASHDKKCGSEKNSKCGSAK